MQGILKRIVYAFNHEVEPVHVYPTNSQSGLGKCQKSTCVYAIGTVSAFSMYSTTIFSYLMPFK